jgi:translation elongation factor EF-Tu-like GTPase
MIFRTIALLLKVEVTPMAARKKAKTKARKNKKPAPARKAVAKKKTAPRKKTAAGKKTAAKSTTIRAAPAVPVSAPAAPPGMERVGIVTHYYNHLSVAIVRLDTGSLRVGDTIHIKGHTSDFSQPVDSLEIDHVHVDEVRPGQSFGLRVKEHAREHDLVYKAKQ